MSHTEEQVAKISCPTCGETFSDQQLLARHKSQSHTHRMYSCKSCNIFLPGYKNLSIHNKACHGQVTCSFCREFVLKGDLRKHILQLHKDVLPTCGVCGLKAVKKFDINKHQRMVHMKEKNVTCPVCKFECFSITRLKNHMISHKAEKLYECRYCKKTFPRRQTWKVHEKIHTGEKNKVCKICDAAFVQKASLNYHMVKHHPDNV